MYEVKKTKTYATCGGTCSKCTTYQDHPDWEKMKKMRRQIPPGELAFFCDEYCLCRVHAVQAIDYLKTEILNSEEEAKKAGWI